MRRYIEYKCLECNKTFILPKKHVTHSAEEARYITCPYFGRHKNLVVVGCYDNLKKLMEERKAVGNNDRES